MYEVVVVITATAVPEWSLSAIEVVVVPSDVASLNPVDTAEGRVGADSAGDGGGVELKTI